MRLIDADKLILHLSNYALQESPNDNESAGERRISEMVYKVIQNCMEAVEEQPTAYNPEKVVEEIKKLDLDGVSMVEDGKYTLVRKNEVTNLIQTNGVCNGRHNTCADCYKMQCPLSTEKTIADKWSDEVKRGGVE